MKFGKLEDVKGLDLILPEDDSRNKDVLSKFNTKKEDQKLHIGSTSWGNKAWKGSIYPPNAKAVDFLKYYSEQFDTIELNTTHYGIPKLETVEKWKNLSETDFIFCPKLLQTISHSRDLGQSTDRLKLFIDAISILDNKLGPCFMQLPPYFKEDRLSLLASFLNSYPKALRLAVEFRNENLFIEENSGKVYNTLLTNGATAVITDVAGRRDVLHQFILSDYVVIRFVANNHSSDLERIDQWIERFKIWYDHGIKDIFFFIHSPSPELTPKISVYLSKGMNNLMKRLISRAPLLIPKLTD